MNKDIAQLSANVVLELEEMKKLGMRVSKRALEKAKDLDEMSEFQSMRVSECADLLRELY